MFDYGRKKCSYCGEEISSDLRRCPYCGSLLGNKAEEIEVQNEVNTVITPEYTIDAVDIANEADEVSRENTTFKEAENTRFEASREETRSEGEIHDHIRKEPLSNGMKVFLTVICTVIPGLGQLAGIIMSILFMNTEDDADRKSFGTALLAASLVFFVISCVSVFILLIVLFSIRA